MKQAAGLLNAIGAEMIPPQVPEDSYVVTAFALFIFSLSLVQSFVLDLSLLILGV